MYKRVIKSDSYPLWSLKGDIVKCSSKSNQEIFSVLDLFLYAKIFKSHITNDGE